jgi:hypothetical protein
VQDHNRALWFSSDAGLCRYDGTGLRIFTIKDGLPENVVFHLFVDRHNNVWCSTRSGYLCRWNGQEFKCIASNKELTKICASNTLNNFFLTAGDTIICATNALSRFIIIPPENNYSRILTGPWCDGNRCCVSARQGGLTEVVTCPGTIALDQKDSTSTVSFAGRKIPVSIKNVRFIASNSFKGSLDAFGNYYTMYANVLTKVYPNDSVETVNFSTSMVDAIVDRQNNLWIGLRKKGGLLYRNCDLSSQPIPFLQDLSVSDVLLDHEGGVWACTLEKGIFYSASKDVISLPLGSNMVAGLEAHADFVLAGRQGGQLLSIYGGTALHRDSLAMSNKSTMLTSFNSRKHLFGTTEGLIYNGGPSGHQLIQANRYRSPIFVTKKILEYSGDTIVAITHAEIHFVWKQQVIKTIQTNGPISAARQFSIGRIFFASGASDGLYELTFRDIKKYKDDYPVLNTRINDFVHDRWGRLWVATNEKGIILIRPDGSVKHFTVRTGLPSDKVNSLSLQNDGTIWAGTNSGLCKLITDGSRSVHLSAYTQEHGLPSLEIQKINVSGNLIVCASTEHLFWFPSNAVRLNTILPLISLSAIKVNEEVIDTTTSSFAHDQNSIEFSFHSAVYRNIQKKNFIYQLVGFDKSWKYTNQNAVRYTNLSPGKYTFRVRALNNDKLPSETAAKYSFEIAKPFWLLWWVIALEVLIVILIVNVIIRWRIKQVRRMEQEKTFFSQQMAEFHMTAIRAQMNPHFLFNAISSIQHFILQNDTFRSYDYLSKFSMLVRKVLDNSQKEFISVDEELSMLKLYVGLEQIRFQDPFEAVLKIEGDATAESIQIPTMLIQPFVENAIWHGLMPLNERGHLSVIFRVVNDRLHVSIRDNGVGRKQGHKVVEMKNHVSKGMQLIGERLQALQIKYERNFYMEVVDHPRGTEVRLDLPLFDD